MALFVGSILQYVVSFAVILGVVRGTILYPKIVALP
jgi:hypothetical protein